MLQTPEKPRLIKASELPYVSLVPADGRAIVVNTFFDVDAKSFYACSRQPGGAILLLKAAEYVQGTYLAKASANPELDCRMPCAETLIQRFSFPDVLFAYRDAERDLMNGLGSLHKYFVLLAYAQQRPDVSNSFLVGTEIEYAFGNHRSMTA